MNAKFICQDIRTITFDKEFDVVLNMADGAIGYLEDDGENHKIFSVIAKALKNGGKHFMDIMNGSYAQTREFDTLKSKKVPQSLEIGLFFCQIFIFII